MNTTTLPQLSTTLLVDELPEPHLSATILWAGSIAVMALLTWAAFAPLDEVSRAPGSLVAKGNNPVVQHMDGGLLRRLLVHEGQSVKADQVLLELDDGTTVADLATAAQRVAYLSDQLTRLQGAQSGSVTTQTPPELRALINRRATLQASAFTAGQELQRQRQLQADGLGTVGRVYAAQRDQQQVAQQLASLEADVQDQIQRTGTDLQQQREQVTKLTARKERLTLRAPVSGVVQGLRLNTPGAVVQPGATLMEIIPAQAPLEAQLQVAPQDIAAIHVGQKVMLKVSAYDYSRYGAVEGRLSQLSPDTQPDAQGRPAYQARVTFTALGGQADTPGARSHPLRAGMTVQADIVTGRRTILGYLLRPIQTTLHDAWQEK